MEKIREPRMACFMVRWLQNSVKGSILLRKHPKKEDYLWWKVQLFYIFILWDSIDMFAYLFENCKWHGTHCITVFCDITGLVLQISEILDLQLPRFYISMARCRIGSIYCTLQNSQCGLSGKQQGWHVPCFSLYSIFLRKNYFLYYTWHVRALFCHLLTTYTSS